MPTQKNAKGRDTATQPAKDGVKDRPIKVARLRDLRRFPHGVGGITRRGYAALAKELPACDDLIACAILTGD